MALIQLVNETKLRTLKFGADRPQGGSSPEPFIRENIPGTINQGGLPGVLTGITAIAGTLPSIFDPGILLATQASVTDTVRLQRFFATPKGLVFTAKQNLLSRIGARTQASGLLNFLNNDTYRPANTIAQAGVNVFGGHLNKQGLNPYEGIGKDYTPGQYIDAIRTGVRPQLTFGPRTIRLTRGRGEVDNPPGLPQQYEKAPKLVSLKKFPSITEDKISERLINLLGSTLDNLTPFLFKYSGGPGSQLGIGSTVIKFATDNKGVNLRTGDFDRDTIRNSKVAVWENTQIFEVPDAPDNYQATVKTDFRKALRAYYSPRNLEGTTAPFRNIPGSPNLSEYNPKDLIFADSGSMAAALAPDYVVNGQTNIEARVNLNNPAAPGRNFFKYEDGTGKQTYDTITAFPIYKSDIIPPNYAPKLNDLVKFRIAAIDNDNPGLNDYIHFRAFLGPITDNYSAEWDSISYMGRGDKLYSYKGFNRSLSLSWTVAAQSKQELIPMYQELNFLASNLAPDYNTSGYMRGPLVYLTIGGYLYEVPGFISSMTLQMSEESPWEIGIKSDGTEDGSVKELSHIITVSGFSFTPIHRFIPRKQVLEYDGSVGGADAWLHKGGLYSQRVKDKTLTAKQYGVVNQFDRTRYISLNTGTNNNYSKGNFTNNL